MDIELVAIGDEVLNGYTVNENASFIAKSLLEAGFLCSRHTVVGDNPHGLKKVLDEAHARSTVVITTGGLGPTCDDWTRKVVSELFNRPLEKRQAVVERLTKLFGADLVSLEDQSMQPQGALLLENSLGTAPGFIIEEKGILISLPGVPSEMQGMLGQVIDFLKSKFKIGLRPWTEVFHFCKKKEIEIDPTLRVIEERFPHVLCGIYPAFGAVTVRLTTKAQSAEEADRIFAPARDLLLEQFGKWRYTSPSGRLDEAVHLLLIEKNVQLATAESCTGGALAATFVANPDASRYFVGSIVSYANSVKTALLHVDSALLESKGAVSEEATEQMAREVRKLMQTDCGIAVSGILGPKGGSEEKPVGTICASIALGMDVHSWTMQIRGNRKTIRERAIQQILIELFLLLR